MPGAAPISPSLMQRLQASPPPPTPPKDVVTAGFPSAQSSSDMAQHRRRHAASHGPSSSTSSASTIDANASIPPTALSFIMSNSPSANASRDSLVPELCRSGSEDGASSISTLSSYSGNSQEGHSGNLQPPWNGHSGAYTPSRLGVQLTSAHDLASSTESLDRDTAIRGSKAEDMHTLSQAANYAALSLPGPSTAILGGLEQPFNANEAHSPQSSGLPAYAEPSTQSSLHKAMDHLQVTKPTRPPMVRSLNSNYTSSTAHPSPPSTTATSSTNATPAAIQRNNPLDEGALGVTGPQAQTERRAPTIAERLESHVESPVQSSSGCSWSSGPLSVHSSPSPASPQSSRRQLLRHSDGPQQQQQQQQHGSPLTDEMRARAVASPDSWRSLLPEHDPFYASEAVLASRFNEARRRAESSGSAAKPSISRMDSDESRYSNTCQSAYVSSPRRMSNSSMISIQSTLSLPSGVQQHRNLAQRDRHQSGESWRSLLPENDPSIVREKYLRRQSEREESRRQRAVQAALAAEQARLHPEAPSASSADGNGDAKHRRHGLISAPAGTSDTLANVAGPASSRSDEPPAVPPKPGSSSAVQLRDSDQHQRRPAVSQQWLDDQRRIFADQRGSTLNCDEEGNDGTSSETRIEIHLGDELPHDDDAERGETTLALISKRLQHPMPLTRRTTRTSTSTSTTTTTVTTTTTTTFHTPDGAAQTSRTDSSDEWPDRPRQLQVRRSPSTTLSSSALDDDDDDGQTSSPQVTDSSSSGADTDSPPMSIPVGREVEVELFPSQYVIRVVLPRYRFAPQSIHLACSQSRILHMTVVNGAHKGGSSSSSSDGGSSGSSFERQVPFRQGTDADLRGMKAYFDSRDLIVAVPRRSTGVVGVDEDEVQRVGGVDEEA